MLYLTKPTLQQGSQDLTEENLGERFLTRLPNSDLEYFNTKQSDTNYDETFCFVTRIANAAGEEGPISSVSCAYEPLQLECGTTSFPFGCSSIGSSSAGLFTMMFGALGLVRRRKEN